jgi:hypothetical protein
VYKAGVVFIMILASPCLCQEIKTGDIIASIAEELAADEDDPAAINSFSEQLFELYEDPVRINTSDTRALQRLFFLTDFQVSALGDYVRTKGAIVSPYEIINIPGFNEETVRIMVPFITLDESVQEKGKYPAARHSILANMIVKNDADDITGPGSPIKILAKYRITAGNFSGGFTAEKDPGETFLAGQPPAPDFLSANLSFKGPGFIKQLVIGDYSARFGLGTGINTTMRTGLSLTAPGNMSVRNDMKPYTSTDENNFFRGVAAILGWERMQMSVFLSSNLVDATITGAADSSGPAVRSLYKAGIHNTTGTIDKMDRLSEKIMGINMSVDLDNLRTGILYYINHFSIPFLPDTTDPACLYYMHGSGISDLTFYYNGHIKRTLLSGEISSSGKDAVALVQCISFHPADRLSLNLLYRFYSPQFVSFHGRGPGVTSTNNNEQGLYGNVIFEAAGHLFISAGSDIISYPWLRYTNSSPSSSARYEVKISYLPSEQLTMEVLYDSKTKVADNPEDNGVPSPGITVTRSFRTRISYSPGSMINFITRFDYKKVRQGSEGFLLLQDINVKSGIIPLSVWIRYCIFNTGGFDSGIYTWENDLLSGFSIPVMYGSGSRSYIMISLKPWKKAEMRFKYGSTWRKSSEGIAENISEFRMQVRVLF